MKYTARTDVGLKRENNEDNLYAKVYDQSNALFVVCDGLGGYSCGEVASKVAVNCIKDNFEQNIEKLQTENEEEITKYILQLILTANEKIFSMQMSNPKYNIIYYSSVGDSRLYYIDNNIEKIEQITIDDTYVNELIKKKIIDKSEAQTHPQKHVLTKALGIFNTVETEVKVLSKEDGYLLLCSDGLTNMLKNEDILQEIKKTNFMTLSDSLVDSANRNGGTDNISVVVVEI